MKASILILAILAGVLFAPTVHLHAFSGEKRLVARLPADELKEYYGLQYLLSDTQKMEYLSLPTASERAQWIEKFWIGIDPTPTTEENEVRLEHERRVELARRLFHKDQAPGWDGRGEMLIRFGSPSSRCQIDGNVTTLGHALGGELWYYDKLNMSVRFYTINRAGNCVYNYAERPQKLVGPPIRGGDGGRTLRNRPPFEPPEMDYIADETFRKENMQVQPYAIQALEAKKDARAADNFFTYMEDYAAVYSCDTEWKRLPLYFDIASFRGGDQIDRTDVSFEVPARDLKLEGNAGKSGAEVELSVLVRDEKLRRVASGVDVIRLAATADARTTPTLLPGQILLALRPGRYHVGIEARERYSNRRAAFRTDVDLPTYTGSPCISDIQFASSIAENEENSKFVKGNLRVVPHPLHTYRIPFPIVFYFEIYGLDTDKEGKAFYRVEYRIVPLEKKRWGPVLQETPANVGSAIETSGYGSTQPQRLSIATNELWEGPFRLDVTVTDRRTFKTAVQSAKFSIVK